MRAHIAYAAGSPCPSLILDSRGLPAPDEELIAYLTGLRRHLDVAGGSHILKFAMVRPSEHPMFDLDYRFVQALPDAPFSFDLRGSCGHSIMSAVVAGERLGLLGRLAPGDRVRVRVLNDGSHVVCEADAVDRDETRFRVYFMRPEPTSTAELLMTGEPRTPVPIDGGSIEVSLMSIGNPYSFVDARTLGITTAQQLFDADGALFELLSRIRAGVTRLLGWPDSGSFPKIAALLPAGPGRIAVRAISVPSWHPTIALTGAICLAAAVRVPRTVPWQLAHELGPGGDLLEIVTPDGTTSVSAHGREVAGLTAFDWISIDRKRVTYLGSFALEPPAQLRTEELAACLASSMSMS